MMIIKSVILFIVLFLSIVSCQSNAQQNHLTVEMFEKAIENKEAQLLDVRTLSEYNSGHLKNALLADWTDSEIFKKRIQSLDKNKPVLVYCLSGGRSSAAVNWLKKAGFQQVYHMEGGMVAWKQADKPVEGLSAVQPISLTEYFESIPAGKTVLVDIGATWCPPCRKMEPVLQEIQNEKGKSLVFIKIDGGAQAKLAAELQATEFPTFIIYKNKKEMWRTSGLVSKQSILQHLE